MGVLDKLGSSFGLKRFSGSNASPKSNEGYHASGQQHLLGNVQLATYLLPGSAAVQVSGSSMAKPVASLQPGEKILGVDIVAESALTWVTLQHVEVAPQTSKPQNTIVLGVGGDDSASLKAEQVVLVKDRKKKLTMQSVRRLQIGVDSVIVFSADGLQWQGKKAKETKKVSSARLVRDKDPTECFYNLTVGSTDHSLLMSCAPDAQHFFVVNPSNSTIDLKAMTESNQAAETSGVPKMEIKNTFLNVESEADKEARDQMLGGNPGLPRSYSDTDIHKLEMALERDEAENPIFGKDDLLDLSSNQSSTLTSKSRASSFLAKSEVSSKSGGSLDIAQVRVGTESIIAEDGYRSSQGTNTIQLTDYTNLPVNEFGVRLPAASIDHQPGKRSKCRKCAFYNTLSINKGKMCKNGALCDFCHDKHARFLHRR